MERLADYIQGERVVRELRRHAPEVLGILAGDLEQPLSPPFERALARSLYDRRVSDFTPSRVLMPAMMATFEVRPTAIDETGLAGLETVCDGCEAVGRCWRALRDHAGVEACRGFCPNAEAFMAAGPESV